MISRFMKARRARPPVVRQYTETDCGPACLVSVLRHFGGDASLAEVRHMAGTDTRGSSMFQLVNAAAQLGLEAEGATGTFDDLRTVPLPLIAHVVTEAGLPHYVVVERIAGDEVRIMDPAEGRRRLTRDAFEALWSTRAALLVRPGAAVVRHPSPPWWRWIGEHLHAEQAFLTQSVFLGVLYTGLGLLTSLFIQTLLDDLIPAGEARPIVLAGALLLIVLMARAVVGYGRSRILAILQRRVGRSVNHAFVARLFRIPLSYFERTRKGDVTARLQDSLRLQTGAVQLVGGAIVDGTLVIGVALGLLLLAPPLLWIAVLGVPLYGLLLLWTARELHRRQAAVVRSYTDAEARYIDSLQGIRELLGGRVREPAAERNHASWNGFLGSLEQFATRQASLTGAGEALGSALLVGALILGAVLVLRQELQLGQMVAGYSLIAMLLPAVGRLAELFVTWQGTRIAGARVFDILNVPEAPADGGAPFRMAQDLAVEHVSFTWHRGHQQLRDVSLVVPRGRVTGLRGANGAGKTTLVKLLRREYEPTTGRVLVDGVDAETISRDEYQTHVALLSSDVPVFSGTLLENIALGRVEVTPERIVTTIVESGLGPLFGRFAQGLLTVIGEDGQQISAGERHALGLVRALAGAPSVLIVDEAFAMLDRQTCAALLSTVRRLSHSTAVLLISHDPDILAHADVTYTLEGGCIVPADMPAAPPAVREELNTLVPAG